MINMMIVNDLPNLNMVILHISYVKLPEGIIIYHPNLNSFNSCQGLC